MGRRGNAIIAAAEIDAIEVKFEDFLLGEAAFEPERKNELLGFPGPRPFWLKEQVLDELLCDRRAALHDLARAPVSASGAQKTQRVEAE